MVDVVIASSAIHDLFLGPSEVRAWRGGMPVAGELPARWRSLGGRKRAGFPSSRCGAAWPRRASALAGTLGDAHGAEPVGLRGVHGEVEIVAALVRLGAVALVISGSVDLDRHQVLGVPVVLVVRPAAERAARLALRRGQAVRPLDVPDVAAFKRGGDTVAGVLERVGQPGPPPDATAPASVARNMATVRVLRDRPGDPRVCPLERRRGPTRSRTVSSTWCAAPSTSRRELRPALVGAVDD